MTKFRVVVLGIAAAGLVLASCSDDPRAGTPSGNQPTVDVPTEPTVSVPGDAPTDGVPANTPKVANPVPNLDGYKADPCTMLTEPQASDLGYDAKIESPKDAVSGPECKWHSNSGDDFSIVLQSKQPLGIGGIYRNHSQQPYAYFEPVDIAGFPGVFNDTLDERADGFCGLDVGVTDQQIITLTATTTQGGPDQGDPCGLLKKAAGAAVKTMSKG